MAVREPRWRMENTQHSENMKSRKEILQKQRQLENQVVEEVEQLWEETQRARNEAATLKKLTKQQQDVIDVLMAEKHERGALIEELRLQLENVKDKLKKHKADASREANQLHNIQAAIYHERETLERQYLEIKTAQDKLLQYVRTHSQNFQGLEEPVEANKQRKELIERVTAESLLNLVKKNEKIMLEANQAREQMEKTMSDLKQELERNKEDVMQQRSLIKHLKHSMNVSINKMKQRWTEIRDVQDVPAAPLESRIIETEGKTEFLTANIRLFTILEEKKRLWEVLESTVGMSSGAEAGGEIEQDTGNVFGQDSMETNNEDEVRTGMKRVILEVEGIREMLRRVREDSDQSKRETAEEKNQIKWMNVRAKKQRRVLDQRLERNIQERDDLELREMRIQRQKEEVEKKLQDTTNAFVRMAEVKATMQKAAAEILQSGEELLRAQTLMKESSNQANKLMDKLVFMKMQIIKWISTKKPLSMKTPSQGQDTGSKDDSFTGYTLGIQMDRDDAEDKMRKEDVSLQILIQNYQQPEICGEGYSVHSQRRSDSVAVEIKEQQNVLLQMQSEGHEETVEDEQTELETNIKDIIRAETEIFSLKEVEGNLREEVANAMETMDKNNQEIKRIISEINELQSHGPEIKTELENYISKNEIMEQRVIGHFEKTEYEESANRSTDVFEHKTHEYEEQMQEDEAALRPNVTTEVDITSRIKDSREDLTMQAEEVSDLSTTIQRLKEEIHKTKEIIGFMEINTKNQPQLYKTTKEHRHKNSEADDLIQDMKEFQELLKIVQTTMRVNEIHLKDEMSSIKAMKFAAKKQKRELEQRLEEILREKDELNIFKLKMQSQTEMRLNKLKNLQSSMKKITARNDKNSEKLEVVMKETNIKIQSLDDMNRMIKGTKQGLENICISIMKEKAVLEKTVREIRQQRGRQSVTENVKRDNGGLGKAVADSDLQNFTKMEKEKGIEELENEVLRLRSDNKDLTDYIKQMMDMSVRTNTEHEQLKHEKENIEMLQKNIQVELQKLTQAKKQSEAKIQEMNDLSQNINDQKSELDESMQMYKRQLRELELLKVELEAQKKENIRTFKNCQRKKEEGITIWNELQKEREIMKREMRKKSKELDRRLEKTMRERDELELLKKK
ncbi:hypothetical protein fugu_008784 [Takifugu bimaculatus]|uniref:Uncharacterized protein n=1 Tax=Takifugu bimaculatus TaxID=433685 RepID=A0A4Z2AYR8_9TELE|nr:hypothetical protein fugu_008784 [Takifugu bimaculatus]